jgi:hypothetical protein
VGTTVEAAQPVEAGTDLIVRNTATHSNTHTHRAGTGQVGREGSWKLEGVGVVGGLALDRKAGRQLGHVAHGPFALTLLLLRDMHACDTPPTHL